MKKLFILLFLGACLTLSAALSPIHQSINEINAILHDERLTENLGQSDAIEEIYCTAEGYLIVTENYEMLVELIYEESQTIGPRKYKLVFHTPRER